MADIQVRLGPPSWMSPVQTSSLSVSRVEREGAAVARAAKARAKADFMVVLVGENGIFFSLKWRVKKANRVLLVWIIWDGERSGISEDERVPFIPSHRRETLGSTAVSCHLLPSHEGWATLVERIITSEGYLLALHQTIQTHSIHRFPQTSYLTSRDQKSPPREGRYSHEETTRTIPHEKRCQGSMAKNSWLRLLSLDKQV